MLLLKRSGDREKFVNRCSRTGMANRDAIDEKSNNVVVYAVLSKNPGLIVIIIMEK